MDIQEYDAMKPINVSHMQEVDGYVYAEIAPKPEQAAFGLTKFVPVRLGGDHPQAVNVYFPDNIDPICRPLTLLEEFLSFLLQKGSYKGSNVVVTFVMPYNDTSDRLPEYSIRYSKEGAYYWVLEHQSNLPISLHFASESSPLRS